jgi:hypothetical protein
VYEPDTLAAALDVDLNVGVCFACLSFVSLAIDHGDAAEIAREVRRMTPDLWADGLDVQIRTAVKRAVARNVEGADAALADIERNGGRSAIARAVVRRLAEELSRRTRTNVAIRASGRDRLSLAPPELN